MQMLLALPEDDWEVEMHKKSSPLFLLPPTTIEVKVDVCLVRIYPDLPICKIQGDFSEIAFHSAGLARSVALIENTLGVLISAYKSP